MPSGVDQPGTVTGGPGVRGIFTFGPEAPQVVSYTYQFDGGSPLYFFFVRV